MRNRYSAICFVCGVNVPPGKGHFERHAHMIAGGKVALWRTRHVNCRPAPVVKNKPDEKPQ